MSPPIYNEPIHFYVEPDPLIKEIFLNFLIGIILQTKSLQRSSQKIFLKKNDAPSIQDDFY